MAERMLAQYRGRPACVEAEQPGLIEGARVYCFGFEGERQALDAMTDRYLNAASGDGLTYRAVSPMVLATFLDAAKLTSTTTPYGWLRDRECALWTLLAATYNKSGRPRIERLVWWMPWVWVDTAAAMMTGRGVWGFPKSIGTFQIPRNAGHEATWVASTQVFKTIDPSTEGGVEPLLTIRREDAGLLGDLESIWEDAAAAIQALAGLIHEAGGGVGIPSLDEVVDLAHHFLHRQVPLVNLKQFRDAADGTRACYQSLVEGPCTVKRLYGGGLLPGRFSASILPCESHPIVDEMGLGSANPPVRFAAWVHMDFVAENGQEVWRAGDGLLGSH
jgi:hypothetical protein